MDMVVRAASCGSGFTAAAVAASVGLGCSDMVVDSNTISSSGMSMPRRPAMRLDRRGKMVRWERERNGYYPALGLVT